MRTLLLAVMLSVSSAGCALLETPCGRVAGSICTIPGEEGSCQALRSYARSDERAQKLCEKIEPSAFAYAKSPTSPLRALQWKAQRALLAGAGAVDKVTAKKPGDKLDKATRKGREAASEAGEALGRAAEDVGEAVDEMIDVIVED